VQGKEDKKSSLERNRIGKELALVLIRGLKALDSDLKLENLQIRKIIRASDCRRKARLEGESYAVLARMVQLAAVTSSCGDAAPS
jgi:hypothetical protein